MATPTNETQDANAVLANIRNDQRERVKLEKDTRPGPDEDIKNVTDGVAAGAGRQAEYYRSGRHEQPGSLISTWYRNDDRRAFADFNCFFFGEEMIKKFTQWRRAESFGMVTAERTKQIQTLRSKEREGWIKLLAVVDQLSDLPKDFPPEIYLEWDDKKKTCNHLRFCTFTT